MNKILYSITVVMIFTGVASAQNTSSCLLHHYPFDGNTNDSTAHLNHLSNHGATKTTDRYGYTNKAYHFENGQYMDGGVDSLPTGSEARTMMMWIKLDVNPDSDVPACWGNTATAGAYGIALGTKLDFAGSKAMRHFAWGMSADHGFLLDYPVNAWFHLAVTYDGDTAKTYMNGQLKAASARSWNTKTGFFFVGKNLNSNSSDNFTGSLDELRIYTCALSQMEIDSIYQPNTLGLQSPSIDWNVYPNPFESELRIELPHHIAVDRMQIVNSLGQTVLEQEGFRPQLNAGSLAAGIYSLKIQTDRGIIQRKLVKTGKD